MKREERGSGSGGAKGDYMGLSPPPIMSQSPTIGICSFVDIGLVLVSSDNWKTDEGLERNGPGVLSSGK